MQTTINGHCVLIDDDDASLLKDFSWTAYNFNGVVYATSYDNPYRYLHRAIMKAPENFVVDHINRNSLDNRKENLRIVTQSVNIANAGMFKHNTSGYRGVIKFRKGFRAQVKFQQKVIHSKTLDNIENAAMVRDLVMKFLFGDATYLNFPDRAPSAVALVEFVRMYPRMVSQFNLPSLMWDNILQDAA